MNYYSVTDIPVKVHGRTLKGANPIPLFWNNSGVEVNCTGSNLWIDIHTDSDFHEPWIATELNGAFMSRQMLLPGDYSICLYRNMSAGVVKNVKFFRELQAMSEDDKNCILVKGFKTDGTFLPVEEKKFKLEFIGDSITSGEGTYGATPDWDWLAMYMSSSRHYATLTAKYLDADVNIISQGGWGVYCGWDNDVRHNIPSVYEPIAGILQGEMNKELGAFEPHDYSSFVPDAIIVNLGTNDASAFRQPPLDVPGVGICKQRENPDGSFNEEDIRKVKDAVIGFLKKLRRLNPTSHIVWAYGMLGYDLTIPLCEAVGEYQKETKDKNVAFLNLPNTRKNDYGAHMHPGFASHVEAAKVLTDYLAGKFGLEIKELTGNL